MSGVNIQSSVRFSSGHKWKPLLKHRTMLPIESSFIWKKITRWLCWWNKDWSNTFRSYSSCKWILDIEKCLKGAAGLQSKNKEQKSMWQNPKCSPVHGAYAQAAPCIILIRKTCSCVHQPSCLGFNTKSSQHATQMGAAAFSSQGFKRVTSLPTMTNLQPPSPNWSKGES